MGKWTDEQREMLYSRMTNEAIAEATGKSIHTVRRMRDYYTGHSTRYGQFRFLPRRQQGVAHVIETAERIGAKILDVR